MAERVIRGRVIGADGEPLKGATVVAYDKGLPSRGPLDERKLGQARTSAEGRFTIEPDGTGLDGTGRDVINLLTRVLLGGRELPLRTVVADGHELKDSQIVFGAPPVTELTLTVGDEEEAGVNAFEIVLTEITPLLGGKSLHPLSAEDVDYLARATGIEPRFVDLAGKAVGLSASSGIPAEALYALARFGHPLNLQQLAALGGETLREGLRQAVEARTIPASFAPRIDDAVRRLLHTGDETVRVALRLRDGVTGRPLAHTLVRAADLDEPDLGGLGTVLTDAHGIAEVRYSMRPGGTAHRLRLTPFPGGGPAPHVPGGAAPILPAAVSVTAAARPETEAEAVAMAAPGPDGMPFGLHSALGPNGDGRFAAVLPSAPPATPVVPATPTSPEPPAPSSPAPEGATEAPPHHHELALDIAPVPGEDAITVTVGTGDLSVAASGIDISDDLALYLYSSGLTTLGEVRRLDAGLHDQDDLPPNVNREDIRMLEAHADLARAVPHGPTRIRLIERGYKTVAAVAATPRAAFVARAGDFLGDFGAARLHHVATAQTRLLNSVAAGELAAPAAAEADGATVLDGVAEADGAPVRDGVTEVDGAALNAAANVLPVRCTCGECSSALGPLAYLADLLRYATDHLREGSAPVDAAALQTHYHQPFADLPVSCQAADRRIRTLRLVVESLREHLRATQPTPARQAELVKAESVYRVAAYRALLARLGTSYEELLQADRQDAKAEGTGGGGAGGEEAEPSEAARERAALAERLGIALTVPAPPEGDELTRLCLELSPGTSGRTPLTERTLEELFGLADTTRDRLSDGAKSGDGNGSIRRWRFRDAAWAQATSPDGSVFVTLTAVVGSGEVVAEVFSDRSLTRRVASGRADGPAATITLVPAEGSGLYGSLDVVHTADTPPASPVEIVIVPRLTSWRLARLREVWRAQDAEGRPYAGPVVDPDVVPLDSLVSPVAGAAAALWQQRSEALATRAEQVRQLIGDVGAPPGLPQFAALLRDAFGIAGNAVRELARRRQEGEDIAEDLAELHLTEAGFDLLARVRTLVVAGERAEDHDWQAVNDVCVRAWKHARLAEWRTEEAEQGVTLSPDHFRRPRTGGASAPPASRWRVEPTAFAEWSDVLVARIGDEATAFAAVADTADEAERETLPALRDALVLATRPDDDTSTGDAALANRAEALSRQLFVDVLTSDSDRTTRAAHAIEALQAMLLAARGELFRAVPKLRLDAPAFDAEWQWIGSYATWRAAMFVHLWPENLLLPALHTPQTPAFASLLSELNSRPVTPAVAKAASKKYATYLDGVSTLKVACSTVIYTTVPGGMKQPFLALFARSTRTGAVYWSQASPDIPWHPQGYWQPIPTGDDPVVEIVGVTSYQPPNRPEYLYLFLKQHPVDQVTLTFMRMDLDTHVWSPPQQLELPDAAARGFSAVVVARAEVFPRNPPKEWNWSFAPQLLVRVTNARGDFTGLWHERQFAELGDGWERDGFSDLPGWPADATIASAADQGNDALLIVGVREGVTFVVLHKALDQRLPRTIASTGHRYGVDMDWSFHGAEFVGALLLIGPPTGQYITNELCLLTRAADGTAEARILRAPTDGKREEPPKFDGLFPDSVRLLPCSGLMRGDVIGTEGWFAFEDVHQPDRAFYTRVRRGGPGLAFTMDGPTAATPALSGTMETFDFAAPQSAAALFGRRWAMAEADKANTTVTNRGYVKELSYLVPLSIAQALARSGEYRSALDWFRICYDYTGSGPERKISPVLTEEEKLDSSLPDHVAGWLADPLAPHRIAATRRNCYTRYTVTAIAQCLRDLGDTEFTADTAESLPRARAAYTEALEVLEAAGLGEAADTCGALAAGLTVSDAAPPVVVRAVELLRTEAAGIPDPVALGAAIEGARRALDGSAPWEERLGQVRDLFAVARARSTAAPQLGDVVNEARVAAVDRQGSVLGLPGVDVALEHVTLGAATSFERAMADITAIPLDRLADPATRISWLREPGNGAGADGTAPGDAPLVDVSPVMNATPLAATGLVLPPEPVLPPLAGEVRPPLRSALGTPASPELAAVLAADPALALDLLASAAVSFAPGAPVTFCVPPNPSLEALRAGARLGLHKLRLGRNIAGMQRPVEPYAAPTDAVSGMPAVSGGEIVVPGLTSARRPTQYRYSALIRRARELASTAAEMEQGMLRAMESAETERFARFKAEQELALAVANIQVHEARITAAGHDITLAELQQRRAQVQSQTYQQWLDAGLNQWENDTLASFRAEQRAELTVAGLDAQVQILQTLTQAFTASPMMAAAAVSMAMLTSLAIAGRTVFQAEAITARTAGQVNSFLSTIERRKEQWKLEKATADQDIAIGGEQIRRAQDYLQVAVTEKSVAETAVGQARDTLEFLRGEFLDDALYDWMSRQLESVYRFFLQQATATARLARQQLAFERQEDPPVQVRGDYWSPVAEPQAGASADRRGLTGAARLREDIQRLDDHAFATDRRRLQLRKTLSLPRLFPMEFQRFRETGVFHFATPMELFDRDFPGHYLRLVRQIRTSVIAGQAPPTEGIRATLSSLGLSRVVIGPETGQVTVLQRAPETVALTSALDATGLIDLEPEKSELLLPFEGVGVDTRWELRMPKPANPFDYASITDVLFTIEYTALDSPDLRHQVIRSLPPVSYARAFSLRDKECWHDLHHPDEVPPEQRMVALWRTSRGDFPPHLDRLAIEQVVLYAIRDQELTEELPVKGLRLTSGEGSTVEGGPATTVDGVISTRRGSWPDFAHCSPVGDWELMLPDTTRVIDLFQKERIQDLLVVVTVTGREPDWPE